MGTDLVKVKASLLAKPNSLAEYIKNNMGPLTRIAAEGLDVKRCVTVALRCVSMNTTLQRCTIGSVFRSIQMSLECGWEPGGALGHSYLVPYGEVCQLIPGYKGLVKLALQSDHVRDIRARAVYDGEEFDIWYGTEERIVHRPGNDRDPNKIVRVYMVAELRNGFKHVDDMTRGEVDAIRARSKARNNGPWVTDYVEMAKKTVVRRGSKMLPMSTAYSKALSLDTATDTGDYGSVELDCLTDEDRAEMARAGAAEAQQEPTGSGKGNEAVKARLRSQGAVEPNPTPMTDEEKAAIEEAERSGQLFDQPAPTDLRGMQA